MNHFLGLLWMVFFCSLAALLIAIITCFLVLDRCSFGFFQDYISKKVALFIQNMYFFKKDPEEDFKDKSHKLDLASKTQEWYFLYEDLLSHVIVLGNVKRFIVHCSFEELIIRH